MFHSALVSEPIAWLAGIAIGLIGAFCAHLAGASVDACAACASVAAALSSLMIGTPINAATFDVLSLLVARPLTSVGLWHAVGAIAHSLVM